MVNQLGMHARAAAKFVHLATRYEARVKVARDRREMDGKSIMGILLLAAARGYSLPRCYAYSDSVTDLPMLETVGNPRAVNPDRALRRIAQQRGWPVAHLRRVKRGPGRDAVGQWHVNRRSIEITDW